MAKVETDGQTIVDGSFDWSGGVDSSKVFTLQSSLNPNGLGRNQLAWMNNAGVRTGGILQRTGWQPLTRILQAGRWQGGFVYEPDGANPYLVAQISGVLYKILLEPPYSISDMTGGVAALRNPVDAEMAFFCQAENILVIQAGDYYTTTPPTLPLFWNGTTLRRSIGIINPAPAIAPGQNEIPAATCMDYYGGRLWFARGRAVAAGDMVGGPSGTVAQHRRDSVISVTENPLCFGGDGFTVPTNAGNIRALAHSANINASLGQGQFYIFTRKTVYSLTVPTTRTDWINANQNNQPEIKVVQRVNGSVGHRCVVPVNGDLFYQAFDPSVRSLILAQRFFEQWGNTPISQPEQRALQLNNREFMRFSGGIEFDNRLLQLVLPEVAGDGINIIHRAILPLDFDIVTTFQEGNVQRKGPAWEGVYDGLQFLELFTGDFSGLPRAFAVVISDIDAGLALWELTTSSKTQNGDNRVVWAAEFPAFTWSSSGYEFKLKELNGGECWIDKVSGTVEMDVYYREDADPCWRFWFHTCFCAARCDDLADVLTAYPCEPTREGYVFPVVFPQPRAACDSMGVRPTTIGYQFQVKIMMKGWCRIRGLILHALPKLKEQFKGIACDCPPFERTALSDLPDPFA